MHRIPICDLEDDVFKKEENQQPTMESVPCRAPSSISKAPKVKPFRNLYSCEHEYWFDEEDDEFYDRPKPTMKSVVCFPASSTLNATKLEFYRKPDSPVNNSFDIEEFCRDIIAREKMLKWSRSPSLIHSTPTEIVCSSSHSLPTIDDVDSEMFKSKEFEQRRFFNSIHNPPTYQQGWFHFPQPFDDVDLERFKTKESQFFDSFNIPPMYQQEWYSSHFNRTREDVDIEKYQQWWNFVLQCWPFYQQWWSFSHCSRTLDDVDFEMFKSKEFKQRRFFRSFHSPPTYQKERFHFPQTLDDVAFEMFKSKESQWFNSFNIPPIYQQEWYSNQFYRTREEVYMERYQLCWYYIQQIWPFYQQWWSFSHFSRTLDDVDLEMFKSKEFKQRRFFRSFHSPPTYQKERFHFPQTFDDVDWERFKTKESQWFNSSNIPPYYQQGWYSNHFYRTREEVYMERYQLCWYYIQQIWPFYQQWWSFSHCSRTLDDVDLEMFKSKELKARPLLYSTHTNPTYQHEWYSSLFTRTFGDIDLESFKTKATEWYNSTQTDSANRQVCSSSQPSPPLEDTGIESFKIEKDEDRASFYSSRISPIRDDVDVERIKKHEKNENSSTRHRSPSYNNSTSKMDKYERKSRNGKRSPNKRHQSRDSASPVTKRRRNDDEKKVERKPSEINYLNTCGEQYQKCLSTENKRRQRSRSHSSSYAQNSLSYKHIDSRKRAHESDRRSEEDRHRRSPLKDSPKRHCAPRSDGEGFERKDDKRGYCSSYNKRASYNRQNGVSRSPMKRSPERSDRIRSHSRTNDYDEKNCEDHRSNRQDRVRRSPRRRSSEISDRFDSHAHHYDKNKLRDERSYR